ncbi:hypothetical protein WEU38_01115 [Cyanobacterium aponinum AL20118]|uniref:Uncharacterized protein n=1 Tax=Cyanobacterium aponinum AL20115 TaxID=3090662 RepID=A0AAF1C5H6_9CHRO|nr:hypothetical protein [Cyanobacterium aponinum]WPF88901.1 hypothetical protein SAY89_01120 [Cyanobacterium aponinum AL20115]
MLIVYSMPSGIGWSVITYMVKLAQELLEADLLIVSSDKSFSKIDQLKIFFPRLNSKLSQESCLLICPSPTSLLSIMEIMNWRKRFRFIAAWIIDSFWVDRIPKSIKMTRHFDHFFVMRKEDVNEWEQQTKTPTTYLPWGADVLRLGSDNSDRIVDLTRVGRQPPQWEDDKATLSECQKFNLKFQGRPKPYDDALVNQQKIMEIYSQSKFLLAFSNLASPSNYTHPLKEYITARWVDALACGATVAGIPPNCFCTQELLWEGSLLDLNTIDRNEGLKVIIDAVQSWTPEKAQNNYYHALKKLDWRWRFLKIANIFNETPKLLSDELELIREKIEQINFNKQEY